jgi:hypothetical protein
LNRKLECWPLHSGIRLVIKGQKGTLFGSLTSGWYLKLLSVLAAQSVECSRSIGPEALQCASAGVWNRPRIAMLCRAWECVEFYVIMAQGHLHMCTAPWHPSQCCVHVANMM